MGFGGGAFLRRCAINLNGIWRGGDILLYGLCLSGGFEWDLEGGGHL